MVLSLLVSVMLCDCGQELSFLVSISLTMTTQDRQATLASAEEKDIDINMRQLCCVEGA